jgi:hypothetical protein
LGSPARAFTKKLLKMDSAAPDMDLWRIPYLSKLLEQRDLLVYNGEDEECEELARTKELIVAISSN